MRNYLSTEGDNRSIGRHLFFATPIHLFAIMKGIGVRPAR
jgi:hypothetical protein